MTEILTTTRGARDLPRWFQPAFATLCRLRAGRIDVVLPDGRTFRAEGGEPGPAAKLLVWNDSVFGRVLRDGDLGFAEAYMDGWWDTPDLQTLLDVLMRSNNEVARALPGLGLIRAYERLRHRLRDNSKAQAARNIQAHYDLGNRFYATWLDETMTYSSALFEAEGEDLAAAQARKYDALCDKIELKPEQHVLEIGCGWGGFAEHAARRGARVTALTISPAQLEYARERIFRAGLAERVDIALRDYRDEAGRFDAIASIEMFEAVGERWWPTYFSAVRDRLEPGGRASIQTITVPDRLFEGYKRSVDFIQKYIFPGGMLPSPGAFEREAASAGLDVTGNHSFGQSYSDTLRRWHAAFNERWEDIQPLGFDERFQRMWNYYLTSCAAAFQSGITDVAQFSVVRRA
ncbi:MAG: cyclopropane-fatty-acyl-phospholipid synthase family protein [Pseudomonadota bacterium]